MIVNLVVLLPMAALLVGIGVWGRRNAESLATLPGMPPERVARRARSLRRGTVVCHLLGAVFLAFAALATLRLV